MAFMDKLKNNKPVLYGGAAALGIGLVVYFRKKSQSAASSATPADTTGNIDPATNFPYGSPEDQAALAQMQSGGFVGDPFGGGSFGFGSGGGGSTGSTGGSTGNQISTNDEWLIAAEGVLPGGNSATVQNGLLGVLGGVAVTSEQRNVFLEAVGVLGDPPGGYPKPIKLSDSPGHPKPKPKTHTIIADGKHDLQQTAVQNGITEAELVHLNPHLADLVGTKRPIPRGTKVVV